MIRAVATAMAGLAIAGAINTAQLDMTLYGKCYITGYDTCEQCCGKWAGGPTASGVMPETEHTVAMELPFGTRIYIDGMGEYVVEDRGVTGMHVDVFCNDHTECYAITGYRDVWIVEDEA